LILQKIIPLAASNLGRNLIVIAHGMSLWTTWLNLAQIECLLSPFSLSLLLLQWKAVCQDVTIQLVVERHWRFENTLCTVELSAYF
jgi:hypothetical protein